MLSNCDVKKTLESSLGCKIIPVDIKEISLEYSLQGLMLKLKLQYFGHLMESQLIEKDPDAGKDCNQEQNEDMVVK